MIWQTFDEGFTSVADVVNGDNVILKVLDFHPVDETLNDWIPNWKTIQNRNYVRGFFDRGDEVRYLPLGQDYEVEQTGVDYYPGRSLSFFRSEISAVGAQPSLGQVQLGHAPRGIMPVGRRENLIRGSDLGTAVVGSPGTMPGDMFTSNVASRTVDGIGAQRGIDYVDVTLNIAAGTSANIYIFANGPNSLFKSSAEVDPTGAGTNLTLDFTWFLGIRPGGSNYNPGFTFRIGEHPNTGFVSGNYTSITSRVNSVPADGIIRPYSVPGTVPQDPTTKPCILGGILLGKILTTAAATIPLRIGWPVIDSTGWYHGMRRGMSYIVPLTAKVDTVFKANRRLQPILPQVPQSTATLTRKRFTFVLDIVPDGMFTLESISASIMPVLRLINNNASQNVLTLCLQYDNTLQGIRPIFFNILTGSYFAGTDGVAVWPGKRFKIAATLDNLGLRWSINGGSVNSYSDGNNTGITQYFIQNLMLDGTGYLFKRLDVMYGSFVNAELMQLSR